MPDEYLQAKQTAGRAAADLVETGMRIGFGTGSTFVFVLERLAERMRTEGLDIAGIPTSEATAQRARELGVPLISFDNVDQLDLAIDGADEVDQNRVLIKGGGGALCREKIVASSASEMIVIVSDNKLVDRVGTTFKLPVEVLPFGWRPIARTLAGLGCAAELRQKDNAPFISDNGNYVVDCDFGPIDDPAALEASISVIPGVLDCGLFVGMAGRVIVGETSGAARMLD